VKAEGKVSIVRKPTDGSSGEETLPTPGPQIATSPVKKRRDESSYHLTEWFSLLFLAHEFYSFSDLSEVTFQGSL